MCGGLGALLSAGCATAAGELRGSVAMRADGPREAFAGPAHLLHVDYDGRGTIELYTVVRRAGTEADCAGPALVRVRLHGSRSNPVDAEVGAGETVCLVQVGAPPAASANRPLRVSWHAVRSDRGRTLAVLFPNAR